MPIQWRELYTSKSSKFSSNLTRNWQFSQKIIFFFIFDFLAKIFSPSRQLSTPGRFDFMKFFVWQMLEKNVSWFQLFVYIFQKKIFFFSNFCFTEKISLSIAYYGEVSIFEILSQGPRPQKFLMKISWIWKFTLISSS